MESNLRSQMWLIERLKWMIETYFPELASQDDIVIHFGKQAKTRLGSIKRRAGKSIITITGYFRNPTVPNYVVDETIAHELTHYVHGFESPLPKLYAYPHEGRIVHKEMAKRGLSIIHRDARRWLATVWRKQFARTRVIKPRKSKLAQPRGLKILTFLLG